MLVNGFMIPAEKVVSCTEWDPITKAIDLIVEKHISAVVVMDEKDLNTPVGIVTKTSLVNAYRDGTPLNSKVSLIMKKELVKILDTVDRDEAAKTFERTGEHHVLVFDKNDKFVGFISSWDIASECAKDARAWPWTRSADGHFHRPTPSQTTA